MEGLLKTNIWVTWVAASFGCHWIKVSRNHLSDSYSLGTLVPHHRSRNWAQSSFKIIQQFYKLRDKGWFKLLSTTCWKKIAWRSMAVIQARIQSAGSESILTLLLTHRGNLSSDLIQICIMSLTALLTSEATVRTNGLCLTCGTGPACGSQHLLSGYYHCFSPKKTLSSMFVEWKRILSCV